MRIDPGEEPSDADGPVQEIELLLPTMSASQASTGTEETVSNQGATGLIGRLALVAAVVGLFVVFATGSFGDSDSGPGRAAGDSVGGNSGGGIDDDAPGIDGVTPGDREDDSAAAGVATAEFRPWPDPPEDHDPHVAGRPGPQEPVADELSGLALVYVNDRGRPTVIDLSTGDQRELDIAGPRNRDTFLVEFGRVVATPGSDVDLPKSSGRAFRFTAERTAVPGTVAADGEEFEAAPSGPTVCLDEGGCLGAAFLSGSFGDDMNRVSALDDAESPSQAIAAVIGSEWWRTEGRWTFFSLDPSAGANTQLRVQSPMNNAVVWVIDQTLPEPLTS